MTEANDAMTDLGAARAKGKPSPHSTKNRAARVLWNLIQGTLFRWSPRPAHRWRVMLLRMFGGTIAHNARPYPKCRIWGPWNLTMGPLATIADDVDVYCVDRVSIGERTTISQYSYLCGATHDFEDGSFPLTPFPIEIGAHVWVAADCFVGPGVTIPDGAVVGARSSVFKDLEPWSVNAGAPARKLRERSHPKRPGGEQA